MKQCQSFCLSLMSNHKVQWVLGGLLQCKCLTWLSTVHLSVPEEPAHNDADSSLFPEGFPGTQTPHLQGRISNTWISRKICGEGAGLSGSKHSTGRQWELAGEGRGRPVRKADCSAWVPTALPQPWPHCFSCQLSLWACPGPSTVSISFSKQQIHPTFALVNTEQKSRKEAWLPSDLVLRRQLLLFSELGKRVNFLPQRMLREEILNNVKCRPWQYITHNVFNLCSHEFLSGAYVVELKSTTEFVLRTSALLLFCIKSAMLYLSLCIIISVPSLLIVHAMLEAVRCVAMETMHRELGYPAFKKWDK